MSKIPILAPETYFYHFCTGFNESFKSKSRTGKAECPFGLRMYNKHIKRPAEYPINVASEAELMPMPDDRNK